jgi:hypothetical protein
MGPPGAGRLKVTCSVSSPVAAAEPADEGIEDVEQAAKAAARR